MRPGIKESDEILEFDGYTRGLQWSIFDFDKLLPNKNESDMINTDSAFPLPSSPITRSISTGLAISRWSILTRMCSGAIGRNRCLHLI
jgi:hypothetical protein